MQAAFLAAAIQQPLIIVDSELRCLATNPAFCGWFGGKPDVHTGVALHLLAGGAFSAPDLLEGLRTALSENTARAGLTVRARDTQLELRACPSVLNTEPALIIVFERQSPASLPAVSAEVQIEALWTLLSVGPYVLFETDDAGVVLRLSAGFERLTGWSPDYWLGKSTQSLVHPDDIVRFSTPQFELDGAWLSAVRLLTKAGDYRRFEVCSYPLIGSDGAVQRVFGICRDVTEYFVLLDRRKDAESEARALFAAMDDIVVVASRDGHILRVLSMPEGILPWRSDHDEQMGGVKIEDVLSPITSAEGTARITAALNAGKLLRHELAYEIDGEPHWFLAAYSPLDDDRVLVVAHDITELKRAEQALRDSETRWATLFNVNPSVLAIATDPDAILIDVNPAWERLFQYSRDEVIGRSVVDLDVYVDPDDQRMLRETLKNGVPVKNVEFSLRRKDGERIAFLASNALFEVNGQRYSIGGGLDITDRKRAEQQAFELALAQERTGVLERLITDVSHDLRNPITVLRSSAYLLERHVGKLHGQANALYEHATAGRAGAIRSQALSFEQTVAELHEQVSRLDHGIERIQSSVEARLYEVRAEHGVGFEFSPQSLGVLIRQACAVRRAGFARRGLSLTLELDDDLPPVVLDPTEFGRALRTIIDHALQDAPDHASVTVRTRREDSQAVIEVSAPLGVNPAALARLSDPAYRAERLGDQWQSSHDLAIAQRIILAHSGKVGQETRPGGVRVWRAWLPLSDAPGEGGESQPPGS